ncbi:glycoside hydrolase family 113 [Streptomyces flavalbus]|uniref:GTA TIM-barrel-like domain-containing protein n=1 Tax=Streptomyces flavalbus TaxID=2665155 RepID=A0ABW2WI93_9ACTN
MRTVPLRVFRRIGYRRPHQAPGPGAAAPAHRGFALPTYETGGYDDPYAPELLRRIALLGANWVQLNPTWYQPAPGTATIRPTPMTASDAGVARMVALAHAQGLNALLKPHVDLDDGTDRATIRPADPDAWFTAYTRFITHYARIAARCGADAFAIGTELAGTDGDLTRWTAVADRVRVIYGGPLVYAANYDAYEGVAFWHTVDLVGVDAYWPLSERPTRDVRRLLRAWTPVRDRLAAFAARTGRPVLFTEAGYASERGGVTAPYSRTVSTVPDAAEQAVGYEALLRAFSGLPWWAGVHWWVWEQLPTPPARERALDYSADGKEAASVVAQWWNAPPPSPPSRPPNPPNSPNGARS